MGLFGFGRPKQNPLKEHLSGFQDTYNNDQKGAMIAFHMIVASVEGEMAPGHASYISSLADIMGFKSDEPALERVMAGGSDALTKILKTLNQSQKEFFVVSLTNLLRSAPKTEMKAKYVQGISEELGITLKQFVEIVKKADLLQQAFR